MTRASEYEARRERGEHVEPVEVGGLYITPDGDRGTFAPACADKHGGHWWCCTCGEVFPHQLAKDVHLGEVPRRGGLKHRLAWVCSVHGPEVP